MANYTQVNIYRKQMQELGLNTKQYAELIGMPYEVVKDFLYDKEGDYSMDIKSILRGNMLSKHQEIENDYENAKIRATEIKYRDNTDKRSWYENEYSIELLLNTLHLKTRAEFGRTYEIKINGKPASKWIGYCMMSKINYDNHEVSKDIQDQYIEQLYDILVNGNKEKYLRKDSIKVSNDKTKRPPKKVEEYKNEYFKWFVNFDIKGFMKRHKLNNNDLANALQVGACTTSYLVSKRHYTKRTLQKLYDYVKKVEKDNYDIIATEYLLEQEEKSNTQDIDNSPINEEIEILDTNDATPDNSTSDIIDNSTHQIELDNMPVVMMGNTEPSIEIIDNSEILRKILINRLTDEEKELIRIFGGKLC